jgi:SecD/SecF fusion protein
VVAAFSLFKGLLPFALEVDQNFIAAILTIVGYSVNDTVVIFDRIRENLKHTVGTEKVETVVNQALLETFSRSIVTAFTVLLVVVLLLIFGGQVLRGMSLALLIGVISGSYSTLFIAVPFLVDVVKQDLVVANTPEPTSKTAKKGKITAAKA